MRHRWAWHDSGGPDGPKRPSFIYLPANPHDALKSEALQQCIDGFRARGVDFDAYNSVENAADVEEDVTPSKYRFNPCPSSTRRRPLPGVTMASETMASW